MEQRIEMISSGIKCDNTTCNYKDPTVGFQELKNYINAPCPKCGENLLTQDDYDRAMNVKAVVDMINGIGEEDMAKLEEFAEAFKNDPLFKGIDIDKPTAFTVDTHKKLSIENIRNIEP